MAIDGSQSPEIGIIQTAIKGIKRIVHRGNKPQEITQANPSAHSYITPEMEDQQLLEDLAQVEPREREVAILQEQVQQSTLPHLEIFPLEFREALIKDGEEFKSFLDKYRKGLYIGRHPDELAVGGPSGSSSGADFNIGASTPKEYVLAELYRLRQLLKYYPKDHHIISDIIQHVRGKLREEEDNLNAVTELKKGRGYLSHGLDAESAQNIFQSGYLCSRQSQLDRFGKVNIATHGVIAAKVVEYPDKFELIGGRDIWGQTVMKERIITAEGAKIDRRSRRERYEILFSSGLYYSTNWINFVFPAAQILQDSSWYVHDGIHIFNQDYDPNGNRKGYEISLQEMPHFVVTSVKNRNLVMEYIRQAAWIEDKETYLKDKVVFLPDGQSSGPAVNKQVEFLAQRRFWGLSYPRLGLHLVPTGIQLAPDESIYGDKKATLYKLV